MNEQIGVEEEALIRNFNHTFSRIKERDEFIETNEAEMKSLKASVEKHKNLNKHNDLLRKENQRDRDLTQSSIEFYERVTGKGVGIGDLFEANHE